MASCHGSEACASRSCLTVYAGKRGCAGHAALPRHTLPSAMPGHGRGWGQPPREPRGWECCLSSALRRARLTVLACAARQDACWVCLGESTPDEPLTYPCHCPRPVHAPCLARWQLHSAGSRCDARGSPAATLAQPRSPRSLRRLVRRHERPAWARAHALAALLKRSTRAPWYLLSSLSGTCTGRHCTGTLAWLSGHSAWLGAERLCSISDSRGCPASHRPWRPGWTRGSSVCPT